MLLRCGELQRGCQEAIDAMIVVASTTRRVAERAPCLQADWAAAPLAGRLQIFCQARHAIADRATEFARLSGDLRGRPPAETLTAEVLPLLAAHRWLEQSAAAILKTRKVGARGRPLWLFGVRSEVRRAPWGRVLVIGPGNYPLFLPGVHALQALVAGNAVLIKPAPGTSAPLLALREVWVAAGLDPGLCTILPDTLEAAREAIAEGVDHVVLTGSTETGRAVLRQCAQTLTPTTMELSGCDVMIVRADADLAMAAKALAFGLRLNGGATCIVPQRLLVARAVAERFEAMIEGLAGAPEVRAFDSDAEAVAFARESRQALGTSVFSADGAASKRLAAMLPSGIATINDLIVPTADPRLPFGGSGDSGFGVTRGVEGLLGMTVPRVVTVTSGKRRPQYDPVGDVEAEMFAGLAAASHGGGWRAKWAGLRRLFAAAKNFRSK